MAKNKRKLYISREISHIHLKGINIFVCPISIKFHFIQNLQVYICAHCLARYIGKNGIESNGSSAQILVIYIGYWMDTLGLGKMKTESKKIESNLCI